MGFDEQLTNQVAKQVQELEAQGADWIICTCSSIGRLAETSATHHAKMLRVDRPMAQAASKAKQLKVLAALSTTLEPTMNLLAEYQAESETLTQVQVIEGAWQHYINGDLPAYQQTIAEHISQYCAEDDVILLAQASMAPAVKLLADTCQAKVLTSLVLVLNI
ncbi:glutamate racemase [Vibrio ponticus]|nr:glutamate racemase [Vibrio ponticus]